MAALLNAAHSTSGSSIVAIHIYRSDPSRNRLVIRFSAPWGSGMVTDL